MEFADDAFFAAPSVPISEITSLYPPRQSSLQDYYNKNPEKLADQQGVIPQYAVPEGEVRSFIEWGAGAHKRNEPEDSGEDDLGRLYGRCVRLSTIGDLEKKKVIFVHGYPNTPEVWQKQIDFFEEDFCVVLVHLPFCSSDPDDCLYDMPVTGFSASEIALECNELLLCLLDDGEKAHLIAHDSGCDVANEMVARGIPLFRTLTLLGNAPSGNMSPLSNFCMTVLLGLMYQYCTIFVYLVARFMSTGVANMLSLFTFKTWPGWLYIHWHSSRDTPEPECHPMLAVNHLQQHYRAFWTLFGDDSKAMKSNIVPLVPTYYAYGMDFFNNSDFETQMERKGYTCEQVGDNHWFFYTHAKEFNVKLKTFLAKYAM